MKKNPEKILYNKSMKISFKLLAKFLGFPRLFIIGILVILLFDNKFPKKS